MSPQGLSLSLDRGACGQCLSRLVAPCGFPSIQHTKSSPNRVGENTEQQKSLRVSITLNIYIISI